MMVLTKTGWDRNSVGEDFTPANPVPDQRVPKPWPGSSFMMTPKAVSTAMK